jgi:hypothetical protein
MTSNSLFDKKRKQEIRDMVRRGKNPFHEKKKVDEEALADARTQLFIQNPPPREQFVQHEDDDHCRIINLQKIHDQALLDAVRRSDFVYAQGALQGGANVNGTEPDNGGFRGGMSALMIAVERGDKGMVDFLLKCGADPNYKNLKGEDAAEILRHYQQRARLIDFNAPPSQKDLDCQEIAKMLRIHRERGQYP